MHEEQDIAVLREMLRLAEKRRSEELELMERINKYNLALIAFAGAFLSLLVSRDFPRLVVQVSGALLLMSIFVSLFTVRPQLLKGAGALSIEDDVLLLKKNNTLTLKQYLLDSAELTDRAATSIAILTVEKKRWTILSAFFLVLALCSTYTLYSYA